MARPGDRLTDHRQIEPEVEAYLDALATCLGGLASRGLASPRRARHAIVAELRDGLLEATTAYLDQTPPWRHDLAGVWLAFPLVGLAIATAALSTLLVVAATGRPSRRLAPRPRLAPTATAAVAIAAIVADSTLLGMLTGQALTAPATIAHLTTPAGATVMLAAIASLTRLALSSRVTRRSLAARAALT